MKSSGTMPLAQLQSLQVRAAENGGCADLTTESDLFHDGHHKCRQHRFPDRLTPDHELQRHGNDDDAVLYLGLLHRSE